MRLVCSASAVVLVLCACAPTDTSTAPPGQPPDAGAGNGGAPASRLITVNASGPGAIRGAGLGGCHAQCTAQATDGAVVTFDAVPDPGAVFSGWSGSCSGNGACSFTVSRDAQVTATFALVPPPPPGRANLIVSKAGAGRVQSAPAGIDCGDTCAATFDAGSAVTLTATPDAGSRFSGWGGRCSGAGACSVTLDSDATVYVTFTAVAPPPPGQQTLTVTRSGNGRVTSAPAGIDCGAGCSAQFTSGAQVTLAAAPDAGWSFSGWSGACTGVGSCAVAMDSAKSVTATFAAAPPPPPQDECAGLAPAIPGAPVRVQVPSGPGQACDVGHADGQGSLALGYHGGGSSLHFFDPGGDPLGSFATAGVTLQLDDQAEGFVALGIDGSSHLASPVVDWVKASGQLAGQSHAGGGGFAESMDDPTGGVVLAVFSYPSAYATSLQAFDAHAGMRWGVPRSDGEIYLAHAVDRIGNTLLLTRIGSTDGVHGKWFDRDGKEQPGFVAVGDFGTYLQLVPRIGSGFFLQTLTSMRHATDSRPAAFVAQIDSLAAAFAAPPAWLPAHDGKKVHPARGGTAYAFIDPAGQSADCTQRIEVVATTGKSCGSAAFNAGVNGACQTASIDVAWDGTVVQQLAPVFEGHDPAGSQTTCTWQWWPGFVR